MTSTSTAVWKRTFDIVFSIVSLLIISLPVVLIATAIRLTSEGPVIYWSDRVGENNRIFRMPKFRTMRVDTPAVATHLITTPEVYITSVGNLLRRTSLDELPQIWSILRGDMSVVGPRPALYNQNDLIEQRTKAGIDKLVPGLTGWAQVNGRDELAIPEKVSLDLEYMKRRSILFDLRIILMTFSKALHLRDVSH